jgi:hypothetical protein
VRPRAGNRQPGSYALDGFRGYGAARAARRQRDRAHRCAPPAARRRLALAACPSRVVAKDQATDARRAALPSASVPPISESAHRSQPPRPLFDGGGPRRRRAGSSGPELHLAAYVNHVRLSLRRRIGPSVPWDDVPQHKGGRGCLGLGLVVVERGDVGRAAAAGPLGRRARLDMVPRGGSPGWRRRGRIPWSGSGSGWRPRCGALVTSSVAPPGWRAAEAGPLVSAQWSRACRRWPGRRRRPLGVLDPGRVGLRDEAPQLFADRPGGTELVRPVVAGKARSRAGWRVASRFPPVSGRRRSTRTVAEGSRCPCCWGTGWRTSASASLAVRTRCRLSWAIDARGGARVEPGRTARTDPMTTPPPGHRTAERVRRAGAHVGLGPARRQPEE